MTLYTKILNEFKNSNIKILSLNRLNQYINFCLENNQLKRIKGKTSHHHILPKSKSCFPQYKDLKSNPWNGTHLLYSDHYYAHWLITEAIDNSSMLFAFCAMHNMDSKIGRIDESDLISSSEFQEKMEERGKKYSKWCKNNPEIVRLAKEKENKTKSSQKWKEEVGTPGILKMKETKNSQKWKEEVGVKMIEKIINTKSSQKWKDEIGIRAELKRQKTYTERVLSGDITFDNRSGKHHYKTKTVYLYNNNKELISICEGSLTKFIKEQNLPKTIRNTLTNNKTMYPSNKAGGVSAEIVNKYRGWFMSYIKL